MSLDDNLISSRTSSSSTIVLDYINKESLNSVNETPDINNVNNRRIQNSNDNEDIESGYRIPRQKKFKFEVNNSYCSIAIVLLLLSFTLIFLLIYYFDKINIVAKGFIIIGIYTFFLYFLLVWSFGCRTIYV